MSSSFQIGVNTNFSLMSQNVVTNGTLYISPSLGFSNTVSVVVTAVTALTGAAPFIPQWVTLSATTDAVRSDGSYAPITFSMKPRNNQIQVDDIGAYRLFFVGSYSGTKSTCFMDAIITTGPSSNFGVSMYAQNLSVGTPDYEQYDVPVNSLSEIRATSTGQSYLQLQMYSITPQTSYPNSIAVVGWSFSDAADHFTVNLWKYPISGTPVALTSLPANSFGTTPTPVGYLQLATDDEILDGDYSFSLAFRDAASGVTQNVNLALSIVSFNTVDDVQQLMSSQGITQSQVPYVDAGSTVSDYSLGTPNAMWAGIYASNMQTTSIVSVSPNGPDIYGNYGPNTEGTKTNGLQEAVNYLTSIGGGVVKMSGGEWPTLWNTVNIITNNISFEGEDGGTQIVVGNNVTAFYVYGLGPGGIYGPGARFKNFILTNGGLSGMTYAPVAGIVCQNAFGIVLENMQAFGFTTAGYQFIDCDGIYFTNTYSEGCTLLMYGGLLPNSAAHNGTGFLFQGCYNIFMDNSFSDTNYIGILLESSPVTGNFCYKSMFSNTYSVYNYFENFSIAISQDISFSNCISDGAQTNYGWHIQDCHRLDFIGCESVGNQLDGMNIVASSLDMTDCGINIIGGRYLDNKAGNNISIYAQVANTGADIGTPLNITGITIADAVIFNAGIGTGQAGLNDGISISTDDVKVNGIYSTISNIRIVNCIIKNRVQLAPTSTPLARCQKYGVELEGQISNISITGCDLGSGASANLAGAIGNIQYCSRVKDNTGFNPAGQIGAPWTTSSSGTSGGGQTIGTIVPAYYGLNTGYAANYAAIYNAAKANPTVKTIMIMNTDGSGSYMSGGPPGSGAVSTYQTIITAAQAAGCTVVGYVDTDYDSVTSASVETQIDLWYSDFPTLNGIFLDRFVGSNAYNLGQLNYYQAIYTYIQNNHGAGVERAHQTVIGNCGVAINSAYINSGAADIINSYEYNGLPTTGTGAGSVYSYTTGTDASSVNTQWSVLAFNGDTGGGETNTVATSSYFASVLPYCFYFFETDAIGPAPTSNSDNPWSVPPTYWAQEMANLAGAGSPATSVANIGYMVPLYSDPTSSFWTTLAADAKANPTLPVIAIVNPNSGPGDNVGESGGGGVDHNYTTGIAALQAAGITVIGYIGTGNGTVSQANIETNISDWKNYYPAINGIFMDEMDPQNDSYVAQYTAETAYAHSLGLTPVFGNPGTNLDSAYFGAVDVICQYENPGLPTAANVHSWTTGAGGSYPRTKFAIIAYDVSSSALTSAGTAYFASLEPYIAWIYVLNWNDGPSYGSGGSDGLPSYETTEMSYIISGGGSTTTGGGGGGGGGGGTTGFGQVGPGGTSSTFAVNTTYIVTSCDLLITSTGGAGVSITITDPSGDKVISGASTLSGQWIPIGYGINFGPYTTAPSVGVYAN